ncbi:putative sensor histidine kinase pdtaS [Roseivivax jejudonensis]|uniref:histidine kinase n=1 Tax=Roseivivax jejudonensis TaxID=1529041 RepID=A0A1X6Z0Q3_9RHOB|nr:sensor histidine kinase [Roseivivax jejudonensis]SLN37398.1 putative sensor histidine kinase pdtaS [Roseivivax jejudonensis]
MIGATGPRPVPSGLGARIIGFLTIALVPLGIVAYWQTAKLEEETRARAQLSVTGITENAATSERRNVLRALGAAQAIGATDGIVGTDTETCDLYLSDFRGSSQNYTFVGVLLKSGRVRCSSAGSDISLDRFPRITDAVQEPFPAVIRVDDPSVSPGPVVVVTEPFSTDGVLQGHVAISIPVEFFRPSRPSGEDYLELLTFSRTGQILTTGLGYDQAQELLPTQMDLAALAGGSEHSFLARSADGEERIFAFTPVVPDLVYALSVWPQNSSAATTLGTGGLARSLPLVMWVASVIVAYLAVNRLVIRHIRTLRHQMRSFARDRRVPGQIASADMALELRDMENDFLHMADSIMQDEAQLENTLREKTILLKEVHHRVKNNLQLISSIMNMQIRQSDSEETRRVLQRLQERIRGLATIHRNLYQTGDLGHVNAAQLLSELIEQMNIVSRDSNVTVEVTKSLAEIEVYPDQAVPMSLLVAEALTNAGKYMQPDADGVYRLHVDLKRDGPERGVALEVVNSCGDMPLADDADRTGLGNRLIQAFATQLGGALEQGSVDGRYRVRVLFRLSDFKPEVVDF